MEMKRELFLLLTLCGLTAFGGMPAWSVRTSFTGDRVDLKALPGGIVAIDYSLRLDQPRITGCQRYTGGFADVLLTEPQHLDETARRIVFELRNPECVPGIGVYLNPILVDEDGERFVYSYRRAPQIGGGVGTWARYTTPDFYAGEAGAAAQDVFELEGPGVDFTPGRHLALAGFRVSLHRESGTLDRMNGRLLLGDWQVMGERFGFEPPTAYLDAVAPVGGAGRVVLQSSDRFQAMPLAETVEPFDFTAAGDAVEALRKRRLVFPVGADGIYSLTALVLDSSGVSRANRRWSHQVYGSAQPALMTRLPSTQRPTGGVLLINPDDPACGVRNLGDLTPLELRLFPKRGQRFDIVWRVCPCVCTNTLALGRGAVVGTDAPYVSVRVPVRKSEGRDAYRLFVDVLSDGHCIDRGVYFYGFRSDPTAHHDRAGSRTDRRALKNRPYNRTTFLPLRGEDKVYSEQEILSDLVTFFERTENMSRHFTYMIDLKDYEVLPGVRDTYLLDRVMDLAADYGCKVTVRAAHCDLDGRNEYRWNSYSRQIASDGTVASGHGYYGAYSVTDERTVSFWLDFYRTLHDRYDRHAAFEGYYIMQPGGEWTVVDQPWDGTFTGYDRATVAGFRKWCVAQGLSDPKDAPRPDFRGGATPDLRPEWIAFCRYKRLLGAEWMKKSVEEIRSYDDDRIVMSYCAPDEVARLLGDKLDYAHNGGNHYGDHLGEYVSAWNEHRVGWITEPHHPHAWAAHGDPGQAGWPLHWSMWVMTAQAAGGGANLHVYYNPWGPDKLDAYGGVQAYDLFQSVHPMLDELHDMVLCEAVPETAFLTDEATLFAKHRTTFTARLEDLRRWQELLQDDVIPYRTPKDANLDGFKVVLPNVLDEVMFPETFEALVSAVKKGAKTVITARTGSFVADGRSSGRFSLLRAFGIPAPAADCVRAGRDVSATAVRACDLFEPDRQIVFETSERQHAQLLDPKIQSDFWRYRWRFIPETDYFGYYPGVKTDGETLATFADGGQAVTRHRFGKGEVIVFWGTPEINDGNLAGMMTRLAARAGVRNPLAGRDVRRCLEGENRVCGRHYLLVWQEEPGVYTLKAEHCPDGRFFVDDMVTGRRYGAVEGSRMRTDGIRIEWEPGFSPLKYLRLIPMEKVTAQGAWAGKYTLLDRSSEKENE